MYLQCARATRWRALVLGSRAGGARGRLPRPPSFFCAECRHPPRSGRCILTVEVVKSFVRSGRLPLSRHHPTIARSSDQQSSPNRRGDGLLDGAARRRELRRQARRRRIGIGHLLPAKHAGRRRGERDHRRRWSSARTYGHEAQDQDDGGDQTRMPSTHMTANVFVHRSPEHQSAQRSSCVGVVCAERASEAAQRACTTRGALTQTTGYTQYMAGAPPLPAPDCPGRRATGIRVSGGVGRAFGQKLATDDARANIARAPS